VRIFNLIKHLSLSNEMYLLSYIESPHMNEFVPALEKYCAGVYTVIRDESKGIMGENLPRSISFFYTPEMINKLESVLAEVRPDLVQIDFLVMSQYVNHVGNVPAVYTEHDMSNVNFEQSFHDRDLPEKMRFIEWNKLVRYEREILTKYASVVVLTGRDQQLLHEFAPGLKSIVIPTGVDTAFFTPIHSANRNATILYVGHYRHYPNYDAVRHFVKDILPRITREIHNARFLIVGSGMRKDLMELSSDNVAVIGEVEDVRKYFFESRVFVAPVRLGGGIKGKVLEAMAMGIPVVASREASTGIRCVPGRDVLVADTDAEFAAHVIALMQDSDLYSMVAKNARLVVEDVYDWRKIAARQSAYYDSLLS